MSLGALTPLADARRPTECLTAGVVSAGGRRFFLVLVAAHYSRTGLAIFTEVSNENGADDEPKHDIYQDVGSWCVDGGHDIESGNDEPAEATPSVLKVDVMPTDNLSTEDGAKVVNALLEQIGSEWSDVFERWES
jgi:hypothetical protein